VLIGVAIAALIWSAASYLRPGLDVSHAAGGITAPSPDARQPTLSFMRWTSAAAGWLSLYDAVRGVSTLFQTADGGRHWRALRFDGGLQFLSFAGQRDVVLSARSTSEGTSFRLFRTVDGGHTWLHASLPPLLNPARSLPVFVDGDHGWILSTSQGRLGQDSQLYRTADGGDHWHLLAETDTSHQLSHGIAEQVDKAWVSFDDPQNGWLGGHEPDGSPTLYSTHDGGQDWTKVMLPAPPGGWVQESLVAMSPPRISSTRGVLVVSDYGQVGSLPFGVWILTTRDAGRSWSDPVGLPMAGTQPNGLAYFLETTPSFADGQAGWRVAGAQVWTSSDSGQTWKSPGALPRRWSFGSLFPVDARTAWAEAVEAGSPGPAAPWRLFVTRDGGRHWTQVHLPK
jgi:photosystem II stability/assembly factor-like uncharacterized protein